MTKILWDIKVFRFACVGIINTVTDLTILNTLVFVFHAPAIPANLVSASISITLSYFLNHHIVFRSPEKRSLKRFAHFFAITGFGILAIQSLVIYIVIHILDHHQSGVTHLVAHLHLHLSNKAFDLNFGKILAIVITMIWNFLAYHFFIFKHKDISLEQKDA
jgi:putative flippase GtrA